jgi:hypothetical protein
VSVFSATDRRRDFFGQQEWTRSNPRQLPRSASGPESDAQRGNSALLALARRRPKSVLDVWLMVVMLAWGCSAAISAVISGERYAAGFYGGRAFPTVALLYVLFLAEMRTIDQGFGGFANQKIHRGQRCICRNAPPRYGKRSTAKSRSPAYAPLTSAAPMRADRLHNGGGEPESHVGYWRRP